MAELTALLSEVERLGAKAAIVPINQVCFDAAFRKACESNACGNYGRCWMCPPDVGEIETLITTARGFDSVLVYPTIGRLDDSYDIEGMMEAAAVHNRLASRLTALFASQSFSKRLHLGAGGCHICPQCAKKSGEACRHPEQAMASLEAYGVDVSALARAAGMKYINGENTVTYFGALFFCE